MNEIYELKASLSRSGNPNISMEAVAYQWLENIYKPVIEQLRPLIDGPSKPRHSTDAIELYCQVLEHKWYLSERAQHDVGHQVAVQDFIRQFGDKS